MSETVLKPCPFCGSDHVSQYKNTATEWWYVFCDGCGAEGAADLAESGAIEAWNKRAGDTTIVNAELEAANTYADKLAQGLPEGMLPKDVEVLREANTRFAQQVKDLNDKCATLYHALEFYAHEDHYPEDVLDDRGERANRAMAQALMPDED